MDSAIIDALANQDAPSWYRPVTTSGELDVSAIVERLSDGTETAVGERQQSAKRVVLDEIHRRFACGEGDDFTRMAAEILSMAEQAAEAGAENIEANTTSASGRTRNEGELSTVAKIQNGPSTKLDEDALNASVQTCAKERRRAVEAYRDEVLQKTGKRITFTQIWKAVGYKKPTEFERWLRCDPKRSNKSADERFRRILKEKPHLN